MTSTMHRNDTDAGNAGTTEVARGLNHHLAIAADLYSQVKQAHWNVVGPNFIALHHLFDEQAAIVAKHADMYAERMRALQCVPSGTIRQAVRESPLPDLEARELPWRDAVTAILDRFETYGASVREAVKQTDEAEDLATQDLYIENLREIELQAYFLRSHLREA